MALRQNFPLSPYETLPPDLRWFPAAEELRSTAYEKLLPPLVVKVREEVKAWRDANYAGASATSRGLLAWWFETTNKRTAHKVSSVTTSLSAKPLKP